MIACMVKVRFFQRREKAKRSNAAWAVLPCESHCLLFSALKIKKPALAGSNIFFRKFYFLAITFMAAATMNSVSRPYLVNSSVGLPLSPKVSLVPIYSIGIG